MISGVRAMKTIGEQAMLYDFYGELLTKRQQQIYESIVFEDMSLGEIAEEEGISRQGVHDLVKRCDRILGAYEEKLGLVEKFRRTKGMAERIRRLAERAKAEHDLGLMDEIGQIAEEISTL